MKHKTLKEFCILEKERALHISNCKKCLMKTIEIDKCFEKNK